MVHLAWLIIPAIPAFAQTQALPSPVGIFLDFDAAPGAIPVEVMKQEVEGLLKEAGLALNWRLVSDNHGDQVFSRVVLLKFKGSCRADNVAVLGRDFGSLGEVHPLGSTKVSKGKVLPFSEVECDHIREALAYLSPATTRRERQRAMGLAMARVVAHELYHILARTTGHAARGLAKASESLEDLVSRGDEIKFREEDLRAMGGGGGPAAASPPQLR